MARSKSKNNNKKSKTAKKKNIQIGQPEFLKSEIVIIGSFLIAALLFLGNINLCGSLGHVLRNIQLGLFGIMGYLFPILLFIGIIFMISNIGNSKAVIKLAAVFVVYLMIASVIHLALGPKFGIDSNTGTVDSIGEFYKFGEYGGLFGGIISSSLMSLLGKAGAFLVMLAAIIISCVVITERSFISAVKYGSRKAAAHAKEDAKRITEGVAEHKRRREENKVTGVDIDATDLSKSDNSALQNDEADLSIPHPDLFVANINNGNTSFNDEVPFDENDNLPSMSGATSKDFPEYSGTTELMENSSEQTKISKEDAKKSQEEVDKIIKSQQKKKKPYAFPSTQLLNKNKSSGGVSENEIRDTAIKLQQTLATFGVNVTVTDISVGPTVTRYELHPEVGVKVGKVLALTDDIKLALAAADIRIEAPIPGKAAIGIEVPNKENNTVYLRELIESPQFVQSDASLAFTVGKDLAGKPIIADIAKMPHLLIAGATGSGKSVCINTLIMSILYKYSPEDVKLIMIDPKIVELSVYNGIPHLLIPVVTEVKKAAGALNWAVSEMEDRYKKFEAYGARDIKAYNAKIDAARSSMISGGNSDEVDELPEKMPLIVIIVDELADLMMQCKAEVETAIVRISQLARAAGIHLVIATQRPSVNVITGLIKTNMPSRISFAVTSGVDSRTILDHVGAERLLGKGDMLYHPQELPQAVRAQGAFVSDEEIRKITDYVKKQDLGNYDTDTVTKINAIGSIGGESSGDGDRDELFAQAGKYIIDKDKASIGNLQRIFRIGFNRAARIMDQLEQAGVVGPEQGTKPREVLMSEEQFEEIL